MEYKIIADSSCDVTPELQKEWGVTLIPLTLTLGEQDFIDDDDLDVDHFISEMNRYPGRAGSAAPAVGLYEQAFTGEHTSLVITLSTKMSASYNNAMLGKAMAEEKGADVHVFDSRSATAGEVLLALKLREFIDSGMHKLAIVETMEKFIKEMKTYFVLGSVDNLVKNGRMSKVAGKLVSALNIKPLLFADPEGNIEFYTNTRGQKQMVEKLADTIRASGKKTDEESLVITHCQAAEIAEKLRQVIKNRYNFKRIVVVPSRGLSALYTCSGGVVIAY